MTKKTSSSGTPGASTLGAVVFGALVGGTAAAAKGLRAVKNGESSREEALRNIARETGTTALAAGTAVAIMGRTGLGPVLTTAGMAVVATGTKYAMDSLLLSASVSAAPEHAPLTYPDDSADSEPAKPKAVKSKTAKPKKTASKSAKTKSAETKAADDGASES